MDTRDVAGVTVYHSSDLRLVLLSDHAVLVLPDTASKNFPLEKYLKNLQKGKKALTENARFSKFVGSLSEDYRVCGLAVTDGELMSEFYEEIETDAPAELLEAVKGMKEIEATVKSRRKKGDSGEPVETIAVNLEATFENRTDAKELASFVVAQVKNGIAELEGALPGFDLPIIQPMIDIMKSIKVSSEVKTGTLRVDFPSGTDLLGGFFSSG